MGRAGLGCADSACHGFRNCIDTGFEVRYV